MSVLEGAALLGRRFSFTGAALPSGRGRPAPYSVLIAEAHRGFRVDLGPGLPLRGRGGGIPISRAGAPRALPARGAGRSAGRRATTAAGAPRGALSRGVDSVGRLARTG